VFFFVLSRWKPLQFRASAKVVLLFPRLIQKIAQTSFPPDAPWPEAAVCGDAKPRGKTLFKKHAG
jgi:hypothetical protein